MPLYRAELLAKKPLRYAALIHDVSQVLYLPFDWDDGSYARDRSGYNNHGTIYGATKADGKIGMARSFDGIDDYVEVPDSASLHLTEITVEAWVYPLSLPTKSRIARKWDTNWSTFWDGWRLNVETDGKITWDWGDGSFPNVGIASASAITLRTWSHIAAVVEGTVGRIYIDGVLDIEEDRGKTLNYSTTSLYLNDPWSERLNGRIDEPRICDRALSQDEIRMLMYRRLV